MIDTLLIALGVYVLVGLIFAAHFLTRSIARYDSVANGSPMRFRLIILPGCVGLWPVLAVQMKRRGASSSENTP